MRTKSGAESGAQSGANSGGDGMRNGENGQGRTISAQRIGGILRENAGIDGTKPKSGAKSGARSALSTSNDPDLARLIAAWPALTPEARAAILLVLDAA